MRLLLYLINLFNFLLSFAFYIFSFSINYIILQLNFLEATKNYTFFITTNFLKIVKYKIILICLITNSL